MTWGGETCAPLLRTKSSYLLHPSRQEGQGTDSWPSSLQYVAWLANSINFNSMTWGGGGYAPVRRIQPYYHPHPQPSPGLQYSRSSVESSPESSLQRYTCWLTTPALRAH